MNTSRNNPPNRPQDNKPGWSSANAPDRGPADQPGRAAAGRPDSGTPGRRGSDRGDRGGGSPEPGRNRGTKKQGQGQGPTQGQGQGPTQGQKQGRAKTAAKAAAGRAAGRGSGDSAGEQVKKQALNRFKNRGSKKQGQGQAQSQGNDQGQDRKQGRAKSAAKAAAGQTARKSLTAGLTSLGVPLPVAAKISDWVVKYGPRVIAAVLLAGLLLGVSVIVALFGGSFDSIQSEPTGIAETEIPADVFEVYRAAGEEHGVPWTVLAGIGQVATQHGSEGPDDLKNYGAALNRRDRTLRNVEGHTPVPGYNETANYTVCGGTDCDTWPPIGLTDGDAGHGTFLLDTDYVKDNVGWDSRDSLTHTADALAATIAEIMQQVTDNNPDLSDYRSDPDSADLFWLKVLTHEDMPVAYPQRAGGEYALPICAGDGTPEPSTSNPQAGAGFGAYAAALLTETVNPQDGGGAGSVDAATLTEIANRPDSFFRGLDLVSTAWQANRADGAYATAVLTEITNRPDLWAELVNRDDGAVVWPTVAALLTETVKRQTAAAMETANPQYEVAAGSVDAATLTEIANQPDAFFKRLNLGIEAWKANSEDGAYATAVLAEITNRPGLWEELVNRDDGAVVWPTVAALLETVKRQTSTELLTELANTEAAYGYQATPSANPQDDVGLGTSAAAAVEAAANPQGEFGAGLCVTEEEAERLRDPQLSSGHSHLRTYAECGSGTNENDKRLGWSVTVERFDALCADAEAAGQGIKIVSAWRDQDTQNRLWAEAVTKYGSADKAAKWVARPGPGGSCTSNHCTGTAIDIAQGDALEWMREHVACGAVTDSNDLIMVPDRTTCYGHERPVMRVELYGFHFPLWWENWHMEVTLNQNQEQLLRRLTLSNNNIGQALETALRYGGTMNQDPRVDRDGTQ